MYYLLLTAVRLVAEQAGDGRLVITQVGGKTGEAVAQHMRRDVGWQITKLGDPNQIFLWPTCPPTDWRTPHRHSLAGIGSPCRRVLTRDAAMRRSWYRPAEPCAVADRLRPSQPKNFTASPSGQDHQPCGGNGRLPDFRRLRCAAKLPILIISQPSLPSSIGEPDDTMPGLSEAKTLANGVGEDGTEQCHLRLATPRPPRTTDRPRGLVFCLEAVLPVAMSCMKPSISLRVTEATDIRPSKGTMWRTIRPRSEISIFPSYEACKAQPTVVEGQKL